MVKNKYYEYRKWSPFWGLFLDGKKEITKVIEQHNAEGWKVVQFDWGGTKMGIGKLMWIIIITILTGGFLSFWMGFTIIFERDN